MKILKKYILKKIFTGCVSIIISFIITFFLVKSAPGNPIRMLSGMENPNPELVQHLTVKYGLDKPVLVQFAVYVKNILKGDFGYSYISDKPVWDIIKARVWPTVILSTSAVILSMVIGVLIGIYSVRHNNHWQDKMLTGVSYVLDSVPGFWLGLILMLIFASGLKILPTSG
ncbi:MAG: ABC transporter permease, partial [Oscillospiraceae bacterium]